MENINYFSLLRESQEKFPINRRIHVKIKDFPKLLFKNALFDSYIGNSNYSEFEIFMDELALNIKPYPPDNSKRFSRGDKLGLLLDKRLQINLIAIFDFLEFLD